MDELVARASAWEAHSAVSATEALPLFDVLTALALGAAVQVLVGRLPAPAVLVAAGMAEPMHGKSLAEVSRFRFFEVGKAEAVTVRNDRLACTAKRESS